MFENYSNVAFDFTIFHFPSILCLFSAMNLAIPDVTDIVPDYGTAVIFELYHDLDVGLDIDSYFVKLVYHDGKNGGFQSLSLINDPKGASNHKKTR